MLYYERQAKKKGYSVIIGIDEVGRGPLAGPIVVGAVYLKSFRFKNRIDDSKKLSRIAREKAFYEIIEKSYFGIGVINESAIDTVNIANAARLAADAAVIKLFRRIKKPRPVEKNTILLFDGRLGSNLAYRSEEITGGDGLSFSIAAASIVAKVVRDRIMAIYDKIYPSYGFGAHKGYGTKMHMERILQHGLSPIHRRTFCQGVFNRSAKSQTFKSGMSASEAGEISPEAESRNDMTLLL